MNRFLVFISILILASLACGQKITMTPTVQPSYVSNATQVPTLSVTKTAVMETVMETPEPLTAIVKAAAINVRAKPDGEVIAILNAGNTVQIVVCRGNWCQIKEPVEGWVWRGCLRGLAKGLGCQAK
jgi:SH3-like domain-containing protein